MKNGPEPLTVKEAAAQTGMSPLLVGEASVKNEQTKQSLMPCRADLTVYGGNGYGEPAIFRQLQGNEEHQSVKPARHQRGTGLWVSALSEHRFHHARAETPPSMDVVSPSAQLLPTFLEQNEYRNPDSIDNCPWHPGYNKELNVMKYLFTHPQQHKEFNSFMTHQRLNSKNWLDAYTPDLSVPADRVLLVDIGGGVGHMCVALNQRYPNLLGRVILQDVPETINSLPGAQPFEAMVHDYYTEQPIKLAKYYYFRNIMHNLTDEDCQRVLMQTKTAMGPGSKILVDDIIVPIQGAHWRTVQLDMLMMSACGAIERTEEQWHALFGSVGMKAIGKYVYDAVQGDALLEVVPV